MSSRERWVPIPSAPGFEASTRGRIRNTATGCTLTGALTDRGYRKVTIRGKRLYVHRLVCEAFHPLPDALGVFHVDHIDYNKANNLRWLAASLNSGRQYYRGRRGWEIEDPPEDYAPMDADEAADNDRALAAAVW